LDCLDLIFGLFIVLHHLGSVLLQDRIDVLLHLGQLLVVRLAQDVVALLLKLNGLVAEHRVNATQIPVVVPLVVLQAPLLFLFGLAQRGLPCVCLLLSTYYKAVRVGEGDSGGHVLRETTSRGLSGLVYPSRTSERRGPTRSVTC